jgi:hypothetical protein
MSEQQQSHPDFPFYVTEEEDGSLTFDWDANHPITSVFNDWTEQDFTDMLIDAAKEVLERHEAGAAVAE